MAQVAQDALDLATTIATLAFCVVVGRMGLRYRSSLCRDLAQSATRHVPFETTRQSAAVMYATSYLTRQHTYGALRQGRRWQGCARLNAPPTTLETLT